jgi:hypothetical protein
LKPSSMGKGMRDRRKLASPVDNPWDAKARAMNLLTLVDARDVHDFPGYRERTRELEREVTLKVVREGISQRAVKSVKLPPLRDMARDLGVKVMTLGECIHRLSRWGEDFSLLSKARRKLRVRLWVGERVPELEAQLMLEDEESRASEPVQLPVQVPVQTGPFTGNMEHAYISREEERERQEVEASLEKGKNVRLLLPEQPGKSLRIWASPRMRPFHTTTPRCLKFKKG